jgi:hypothetical protein
MNYLTIIKWVGGLLGGLALAWIIYAGLIRPVTKPNPSTTQSAGTIVNYNTTPKSTFGCNNIRIRPDEITNPVSK